MIPGATYRIQFGQHFGFDEAAAISPYLADLGIRCVYASPYLQARPGSVHGYDITNHNALNRELGDEAAFQRMLRAFRDNGLGHILDYVPNHMGVGGSDNPFWLDVLEWGQNSRYAKWFDIDWNSRSEYLNGKLLVPFLADQYGAVLESGQIELKFDAKEGAFNVWLYDVHKLPVTPTSYPQIFGKEAVEFKAVAHKFAALSASALGMQRQVIEAKAQLADHVDASGQARLELQTALQRFRGVAGNLDTWNELDALIRQQHWRPTHFRVAADDINYRRFFNISELAGIRMELPDVFKHTHSLVLSLLKDGSLQGLRIDHIDGLYNPKEYLERLRENAGTAFYLIVEKILAGRESLRDDWPVNGTTGYEFGAQAVALMVDPACEEILTKFYRDFTGECQTFAEIVRESKVRIMENELRSELEALSRDAVRVARQDPRTTDFTRNILRRALKETIARFPVYRTYIDGLEHNEIDDRYIHWAIAQAMKHEQELDKSVFGFIEELLTGRLAHRSSNEVHKRSAIHCAMKAQQLSGPVMAKGLEDTALYRYNRFVALNEVGSSPDQFGLSLSAFHKENQHRAEKWPHTMLATSTHDVKHGEDARARLAALSLVPEEWVTKVTAWSRILRARRGDVEGTAPPARNDEYLFFQNLVATWPAELTSPLALLGSPLKEYRDRLQGAMIKSLREARIRSNWISPDNAYENAVTEYVLDALDPETGSTFLETFLPFQQRIAEMGVHNSLVQVLLKITSPGAPDFYQGSELWDLNLLDPDNRRAVDFARRRELLEKLKDDARKDRRSLLCGLLKNWHDGSIKLALIRILLKFRNEHSELFENGSYRPLEIAGDVPGRLCVFRRSTVKETCVVLASIDARTKLHPHAHAQINLESKLAVHQWQDVVTERIIRTGSDFLDLRNLFGPVPIALLIPVK